MIDISTQLLDFHGSWSNSLLLQISQNPTSSYLQLINWINWESLLMVVASSWHGPLQRYSYSVLNHLAWSLACIISCCCLFSCTHANAIRLQKGVLNGSRYVGLLILWNGFAMVFGSPWMVLPMFLIQFYADIVHIYHFCCFIDFAH